MHTEYKRNRKTRAAIVPIGPSIAYIPLTQNLYALIDAWNAPVLEKRNWHIRHGYALRKEGNGHIGMHQVILPLPKPLMPDHENRNPLDNRETNLRIATKRQNRTNLSVQSNNSSGVTGVWWDISIRRWRTAISLVIGKKKFRSFLTYEAAVEARRIDEQKHYGEFSPK